MKLKFDNYVLVTPFEELVSQVDLKFNKEDIIEYDERMNNLNYRIGKCVTKDVFEQKFDKVCTKYDRDIK